MKIVYLDMDGVLADFVKASGVPIGQYRHHVPEMLKKGFFRNLDLIPGARDAVHELYHMKDIDLRIASKPTMQNLDCATEKYQWVDEHFPFLTEKLTLTFHKQWLIGDYLIDDFPHLWEGFQGEIIYFDQHDSIRSWKDIILKFRRLGVGLKDDCSHLYSTKEPLKTFKEKQVCTNTFGQFKKFTVKE